MDMCALQIFIIIIIIDSVAVRITVIFQSSSSENEVDSGDGVDVGYEPSHTLIVCHDV